MKNNLYLFGFLIALLTATYLFQEVRTNKIFEASLTKDHLISLNDIQTLSWGDVRAVKKDGQWWAGDKLLSYNVMKQVLQRISNIKKIKSIEGEKANFFSQGLEMNVNSQMWTIGDLTLDRQGFYISKNNELMVAMIEGSSGELTDDESKVAEIKLEDLKKVFSYKLSDLYETQLFRYYPRLPFGTITIEADGHPRYELDLIQNKTVPPPINGISAHQKLFSKFNSLITQMTIKREVPFEEGLKGSKIGEMVLSKNNEKVIWELWLGHSKSADSYIIDSQRKKAWQMIGGTLKGFFIKVQDFWDKKVIPQSEFKNFSSLKTTFSQDEKSAVVEVSNYEPLKFVSPDHKVDSIKMNILFQYAFNLSDKDQGDRVSQLTKSELKEILSGSHLRLDVLGQELLFWRKKEELIVVNLTQGYKVHFMVADESFRATFEDVIK